MPDPLRLIRPTATIKFEVDLEVAVVGRFKQSGTGDSVGYGNDAGSAALDPAYIC